MKTPKNICPRCKLDLPAGVTHRDESHCLTTLVARYQMLSREYKRLKKSVDFVDSKVAEWKARAKHAEAELIAIQGSGERSHEQRLMQLEQRVKFLIEQQRIPERKRQQSERSAA